MTTSGITEFTYTVNDIITDALSDLNVIGADENPSPEDSAKALRKLNSMIKNWEAQGYHLWKKKTATIFLQKNQSVYVLSSSDDNATKEYSTTTILADELSGQTSISVTSTSAMAVDDFIGIVQSDNTLHWSTVASITDSTTVVINNALTAASSAGSNVYTYSTKLDTPNDVYTADRRSLDGRDIPMENLSYQDYFELPTKDIQGVPVTFNYDRQLDTARIRVWPVPIDVTNTMKITYEERFQIFVDGNNTPDFREEWYEPIVTNLSVKLGPAFGKSALPSFAEVVRQANKSLKEALDFDNEMGSIQLQVDPQGPKYNA